MELKAMREIKVWYYHSAKNFGDQLTPLILNHFGKAHNVRFVLEKNPQKAQVIGIGSVLHQLSSQFKGAIWTSGTLPRRVHCRPQQIFGVRGPLTAAALKCPKQNLVFGDGALLVGDLLPSECPMPKYCLGVMPHYKDIHAVRRGLRLPTNVLFISVRSPPMVILNQMRSCACLVSSSLHGLIAADALGIPNRQFRVSTSGQILGGSFKYRDYYASLGLKQPPRVVRLKPTTNWRKLTKWVRKYYHRPSIPKLQEKLRAETHRLIQECC